MLAIFFVEGFNDNIEERLNFEQDQRKSTQDLITLIKLFEVTLLLPPFYCQSDHIYSSLGTHTQDFQSRYLTRSIKGSSSTTMLSSGIFNKGCLSQQ